MRIGLNLIPCLPETRGGWNYVGQVLAAVLDYDKKNTYVVFVTSKSRALVPAGPNVTVVDVGIDPRARVRRVIFEQSTLQYMALRHKLDVMHWFANTQALINTVPGVVTVYDLQPFKRWVALSLLKRVYLRTMMRTTARSARTLLPISRSTERDLIATFDVKGAPLVVIPPVLDPRFRACPPHDVEDFRRKHRLPSAFWLYVAQFVAYKNHLRLLEAYHALRSQNGTSWPLVLRGDPFDSATAHAIRTEVARLNLGGDVLLLPELGADEMPLLYSAATALVFPSLYEGAGLPVLEAAECGCPVLGSEIPAVVELGGIRPRYFDPLSTDSMTNAMREFQDSSPDSRSTRHRNSEEFLDFSPPSVAARLVDVYRASMLPSRV